ncbi:MAG: Fic family protein [Alphaproteobacteria bacterium]|jgi:Fic family protein|nr:Fic family protein [Alphaproteobacteria bacterium]
MEKKWNWQQEDWPHFQYNDSLISDCERLFLQRSYIAIGTSNALSEPDKEMLIVELTTNEAYKTSEIEGEFLDRESLQSSIKRHFGLSKNTSKYRPKEDGIAQLIFENYKGFQTPLSHETLWEWHRLLMQSRHDLEMIGGYRTHQEAMQIVSGYLHKPKVHFEAPPSHMVYDEMTTFIGWFNTSLNDDFFKNKPILRAAITHLWFVTIHPFEDGNGRIARALVEKAVWQNIGHPFLFALSQTIQSERKGYYLSLEEQNKFNTIDLWLSYFAKLMIDALSYTEKKISLILKKDAFFRKYDGVINERQTKVINKLFEHGLGGFKGALSAKKYVSITGASASTATRDLQEMLKDGILRKEGLLKGTRYFLTCLDDL